MTKKLQTYTFTPGVAGVGNIVLTGVNVPLSNIMVITNPIRGVEYYDFASLAPASYSQGTNSTIVLNVDTSSHNSADKLTIIYDDNASLAVADAALAAIANVIVGAYAATGGTSASTVAVLGGKDTSGNVQGISMSTAAASGISAALNRLRTLSVLSAQNPGGTFDLLQVDGSDNLKVTSANAAYETGGNLATIAANTNAVNGTPGSAIPSKGELVGGVDGSGNFRPIDVDSDGAVNICIERIEGTMPTGPVSETAYALPVTPKPQGVWNCSFANSQSGTDSTYFTTIQTGTGMTVSQSASNLNIIAGTTVNSETILRSTRSWMDAFSLRYGIACSQRIAQNNFFVEMVDVIGDGLTIAAAAATTTHGFNWTRTTTVCTVNEPGHGLATGNSISVTVTSDAAAFATGAKTVTVVDQNTFTFVCSNAGATSGTSAANTYTTAYGLTVTIPSNPFTSANVGQAMSMGAIALAGGSSPVILPQRVAIAAVSGNNVTFVSQGQSGTFGTGTCSLFGWNFYRSAYYGTVAANSYFDCGRKGWFAGETGITQGTSTALPGLMGILAVEDGIVSLMDQATISSTVKQTANRATRVINIPDPTVPLYIQIRVLNGTSAPASSTTGVFQLVRVEEFASLPVALQSSKSVGPNSVVLVSPSDNSTYFPVSINQLSGSTIVSAYGNGATNRIMSVVLGSCTPNTDANAVAFAGAGRVNGTLVASGGGTGVSISADINVTVTTLNSATALIFILQESYDSGATYSDIWFSTPFTTSQHIRMPAIPIRGRRRWCMHSVGGTSSTVPATITAQELPCVYPGSTQFVDVYSATNPSASVINGVTVASALVSTTLSSTSSPCIIESYKNITISGVFTGGTPTTAPVYTLQVSQDATNWKSTSCTMSPTAAGTFSSDLALTGCYRYARLIVTTASSGGTAYGVTYTAINAQ
jgi:hypothetical protein